MQGEDTVHPVTSQRVFTPSSPSLFLSPLLTFLPHLLPSSSSCPSTFPLLAILSFSFSPPFYRPSFFLSSSLFFPFFYPLLQTSYLLLFLLSCLTSSSSFYPVLAILSTFPSPLAHLPYSTSSHPSFIPQLLTFLTFPTPFLLPHLSS